MQSIKSDALEPTRGELAGLTRREAMRRTLPAYGLPILTVALIVLFSVMLPDTFPTMLNLRAILGNEAIIAILSLAATLPMMAGRIDLTVGYGTHPPPPHPPPPPRLCSGIFSRSACRSISACPDPGPA